MEADYSIDLGPTSAALELPWHDPEGRWHYVNLQSAETEHGEATGTAAARKGIDLIPEAQRFPALRHFLEQANSQPSSWESAKCGVWAESTDPGQNAFGRRLEHGSYVDLVLAASHAKLRLSLAEHERCARRWAAMLEEEDNDAEAVAEIVVRRCYFHRGSEPSESDDGYCLSLFVLAYGPAPETALACWERALNSAAACLLRLHPGADGP